MKFVLVACALLAATATANATAVGDGDPFSLTFSSDGSGDITACTCGTHGTDNGTAFSNLGGHGGNGYDFSLPLPVGTGDVGIFNSLHVLVGVLDFIDSGDLDFITSGNLSNYWSLGDLSVTENSDGTFSYDPNGRDGNQYSGTLVSATPLPAAFSMFAGGLGLVGMMARRKKRKAATA